MRRCLCERCNNLDIMNGWDSLGRGLNSCACQRVFIIGDKLQDTSLAQPGDRPALDQRKGAVEDGMTWTAMWSTRRAWRGCSCKVLSFPSKR